MIAVDTNILVYAHRADAEWHEPARKLIDAVASSNDAWAIPWPCIHEFLSVVTHPRIQRPPSSLEQARRQVEVWMEAPGLRLLAETQAHWATLVAILAEGRLTGPRVHDARIAAVCLEHGVEELWSADRDFSRMQGLRVCNPLLGRA